MTTPGLVSVEGRTQGTGQWWLEPLRDALMDSLTSMGESAVLEMDATHVLQTNQPEASVNDTILP